MRLPLSIQPQWLHVRLVFLGGTGRRVPPSHVSLWPICLRNSYQHWSWIALFRPDLALTVNYPPKLAISSLVNRLKGVSSRLIRKRRYTCQQRKVLPENNFYRQNCDQATQLVLPTRKSKVILRQSLSCVVGLFGLQATMLAVVVALRLQFFGSTSKISVLQVEKAKIPVKELLISPFWRTSFYDVLDKDFVLNWYRLPRKLNL